MTFTGHAVGGEVATASTISANVRSHITSCETDLAKTRNTDMFDPQVGMSSIPQAAPPEALPQVGVWSTGGNVAKTTRSAFQQEVVVVAGHEGPQLEGGSPTPWA